jgi:hypothetical protein
MVESHMPRPATLGTVQLTPDEPGSPVESLIPLTDAGRSTR